MLKRKFCNWEKYREKYLILVSTLLIFKNTHFKGPMNPNNPILQKYVCVYICTEIFF